MPSFGFAAGDQEVVGLVEGVDERGKASDAFVDRFLVRKSEGGVEAGCRFIGAWDEAEKGGAKEETVFGREVGGRKGHGETCK